MQISWEKLEHEWRKQLLSDAKGNILEIGVGTGENFKYYPVDVKVTAVDTSSKVIEHATKEAEVRKIKAEFIVSCIDEPDFPTNKFDTIVSTFSLSAYENPLCVLKQFNKWCSPDGTILLLEYGLSKYKLVGWFQRRLNRHHYCRTGFYLDRDVLSIISDSKLNIKKIETRYAGIVCLVWATLAPNTNASKNI